MKTFLYSHLLVCVFYLSLGLVTSKFLGNTIKDVVFSNFLFDYPSILVLEIIYMLMAVMGSVIFLFPTFYIIYSLPIINKICEGDVKSKNVIIG